MDKEIQLNINENKRNAFILTVLFMVIIVSFVYFQEQGKRVELTMEAGTFTSVKVNTGFGLLISTVTTTKGSFPVEGVVLGVIGEELTLEERANGDVYLCSTRLIQCNKLRVGTSVDKTIFKQPLDEVNNHD